MKKLFTSLGVIALLGLTACSAQVTGASSTTQTPIPAAAPDSATPTATVDTGTKSVRGNVVKKLGDTAHFKDSETAPEYGSFAITKIEDVTCTQPYASPSKNGKLIGLTVDLETKPELAKQPVPQVFLSPMSFKYIADNGTTFNGNLSTVATYSCLDQSQILASSFGPAEKAHGIIVLDVPSAGGVLTVGKVEWKLP
jgi:hypothetical protein